MTDVFKALNAAILESSQGDVKTHPVSVRATNILPSGTVGNQESRSPAPERKAAYEFPEVPEGFALSTPVNNPVEKAAAAVPIDRSERLEKLVDDALAKTQELLDIPLIPGDEDFVKVASMQKDLVVSIINTGVKVDENRFKKRQGDALTGILAQLIDREKKLAPLIDMPVTGQPN